MAVEAPAGRERRCISVEGVVQGVGFRPWVHGLARRRGLAGFVRNDGGRVVIEAEGDPGALDALAADLRGAPAPARVDSLRWETAPATGAEGFVVAASRVAPRAGEAIMPVPPDVATCDDCLRELFDPRDRRHGYPFITCSRCGPRFTLVRELPYDRARTTMDGFQMCAECRAEYEDPLDRRFHAETIACPACGPRLSMPLADAVRILLDGGIVAVKGLGGWHLACDAGDEDAVRRLRVRKHRDEKPFAVMALDPRPLVYAGARETALLRSAARPIVLLKRRRAAPVAAAVAPGDSALGVMLPYTPLHHLLLREAGRPLVMTSGNRSDEPIAVGDDEARERLAGIADAFLGHDRPIERRCEDSVLRPGFAVRRSRGYAPAPLALPVAAARPLVATGAQLKGAFCVAHGTSAFLSPHLGDLDSQLALRAFDSDLRLYLDMLGVRPELIAHDLHPDYATTRWALEQDALTVAVQHHHAHAAACLAEHGETGPALAIVLDGSGFGTDGTLWGGELLRCDLERFDRVAHLEPVPLPGGEAAIREPWRMAAAYLERADRPVRWDRWRLVRQSLAINAPLASGAGRLLDAASALLGVRETIGYEGQAAIELERLAGDAHAEPYPCRRAGPAIRGADLIRAAHDDLDAGRDRRAVAAAVHEGLAAAFAGACAELGDLGTVVLSGGCLQNLRLVAALRRRLVADGFRVLSHRSVPPGDGGISFGQAAIAAGRTA
jgi:hydrogenase maturation protein HypF